jgi:hypothetical protein
MHCIIRCILSVSYHTLCAISYSDVRDLSHFTVFVWHSRVMLLPLSLLLSQYMCDTRGSCYFHSQCSCLNIFEFCHATLTLTAVSPPTHGHTTLYVYTHTHMYICEYVCICVCIYTYVHLYMCIWLTAHTRARVPWVEAHAPADILNRQLRDDGM